MELKDYYKTLGVPADASSENIKTAYRKLSKKYHPDINNGDKFFEDMFKEIQEAYEILGDISGRKEYDFKRTHFSKSNNFYYRNHHHNLRKKEEELQEQREAYEKWRRVLKEREDILKQSEDQHLKSPQKATYPIILLLILITFLYIIYRKGNGKKNILTVYNPDLTETISKDLFAETGTNKRNKEAIKGFDGIWKGTAFQLDAKKSLAVKFTCNSAGESYLIEYPSLKCSGRLVIEKITGNEIVFTENIEKGEGICANASAIKLKRINNKKILYESYLSQSSEIYAKGKLTK